MGWRCSIRIGWSSRSTWPRIAARFATCRDRRASTSRLSESIASEDDGELEEDTLELRHSPAGGRVGGSSAVAEPEEVRADTDSDNAEGRRPYG